MKTKFQHIAGLFLCIKPNTWLKVLKSTATCKNRQNKQNENTKNKLNKKEKRNEKKQKEVSQKHQTPSGAIAKLF